MKHLITDSPVMRQVCVAEHRFTESAMLARFGCWLLLLLLSAAPRLHADQQVVVLLGAAGNDEYAQQFTAWAEQWEAAAERAGAAFSLIGAEGEAGVDVRQTFFATLKEIESESQDPLWLVLIGHGTFDGRVAKFNSRGPDFSAQELAEQLQAFRRPIAIINCTSASAPFINHLSGSNRVVVTATKSGFQYNYARFGGFMAEAIGDTQADLDKDDQTSLLEAFLLAAARVAEFYEVESRLPTEHALIDDNGDGLGTEADWYRGVRATRSAKDGAAVDGLRANQLCLLRSPAEQQLSDAQRTRRDELEARLEELRTRKQTTPEAEYLDQLQTILVELAEIYASVSPPAE